MTNGHAMPFGAVLDGGKVRFRLWAPAARSVDLRIEKGNKRDDLPMAPAGGGWFELSTERAAGGALYRLRIDGDGLVPDPASRYQPQGVHGPSRVVDPDIFDWRTEDWRGRPWNEAVIYELHVGTFSPQGTFDGVRERLDHISDLGVTALELMPVASFPGMRNWGYDGVLPFAPDSCYGRPDDLRRLIDDAHSRGLMVFLDVVYNHFGPDGNFLHLYAPQFFTDRFMTPWGPAIDFARPEVREFVIHNALYWLEEFRFDGLRLDAVHAIVDHTTPHILDELSERVHAAFGSSRFVHLILENENNASHYLERNADGRPRLYTAQWNDDFHHACHVLATGESAAYYEDFTPEPLAHLARCLAEGFAYQGEPSRHACGRPRGEPSAHLPPDAFVAFLQNHDQVGNRAFGERLSELAEPEVLRALRAITLLAPSPPLLFMGEEWAAPEPFLFFCDFQGELATLVREGRRREFAKFPQFRDPELREAIPDPNAEETFARARLDWGRLGSPDHAEWLAGCRALLELRRREIVPRLSGTGGKAATASVFDSGGLRVGWTLGDGSRLSLVANLSEISREAPPAPEGGILHALRGSTGGGPVPPWSVAWILAP